MRANTGIEWIDFTFDFCVQLLIDTANLLDISYEEINVYLFCIICQPLKCGVIHISVRRIWCIPESFSIIDSA